MEKKEHNGSIINAISYYHIHNCITVPSDVLKVDTVEMYSRDNAREHRTDRYELVRDNASSCILRRGQPFFMALRMKDRNFDARRDNLRVSFNFGKQIPVRCCWNRKYRTNKPNWNVILPLTLAFLFKDLVLRWPKALKWFCRSDLLSVNSPARPRTGMSAFTSKMDSSSLSK